LPTITKLQIMNTKSFLLYTTLIISLISCNDSNKSSSKSSPKTEKEKQFENFAKQLEISIKEGEYKFLNTSWDIELFKTNVFAKGKVRTNVLEGGEKYYRKVIYKSNNDMVDEVKQYGKIYLSRFHIENNIPKAFYTYRTDQGINFIEFVFWQKDKDIKIVDFYNFQMGEYYSESVFKMTSNITKYGGKEGAYANAKRLVNIAITQLNDERSDDAWETINKIAANLVSDNYFQTKRISVARNFSSKIYCQTIEDFIELNPNNEKLKLYYQAILLKKKGDKKKFLAAAEKLEKLVGPSDLFTRWKRSL